MPCGCLYCLALPLLTRAALTDTPINIGAP